MVQSLLGPVYQSCGLIRPVKLRLGNGRRRAKALYREGVAWNRGEAMLPDLRKSLDFVPRLAAFYAALFILPGIAMPFFPVWLKAKDVDAKSHRHSPGRANGCPQCWRSRLSAREADRRDAVRTVLLVASLATVAGYASWSACHPASSRSSITYALTSLFCTPLMPLAETYAFKGLMARKRAYGPVRLWGSFAFILGNLRSRLCRRRHSARGT